MKRGTILGAAGGLVAGVSLATLALAAPSWSMGPSTSAAASLAAPLAGQLAAPSAPFADRNYVSAGGPCSGGFRCAKTAWTLTFYLRA